MATYNKENIDLCLQEKVGYAYNLARKEHLAKDGYHIDFKYSNLTAKTIAAAILDVSPSLV